MIGVPGTAQRLFGALREDGISVILISQGSSEHSICFAIPQVEAERTARTVRHAFHAELNGGQIQNVDVVRGCSILSVVGDGMAGTPGVAAQVFGSLGAAGVNVRAIAQGSSERNISVVIDERQTTKALRSVHSGFYLSPHTISLGIIGPGAVGGVLLDQLASQTARLTRDFHIDLRLRAVMTSRAMALSDSAIPLDGWRDALKAGKPPTCSRFEDHVNAEHLPHAVILDCSASDEVAEQYPRWLGAGIHVVTPNKRANSGPLDLYDDLQEARRAAGSHYLYEATVGAGLPIIQTLRDLRETGDDIRRIEGILSGTLAYLFNVWDGKQPFSEVVRAAKANGYTEPDPRDDLSGTDVARKLVILGREMGLRLDLSQVELEGLIPASLGSCNVDEFMTRLPELDAPMLLRLEAARAEGNVLRYVAALDAASGRATVGLVELDRLHPFANINLTDNIVRFITSRYDQESARRPGPGRGPSRHGGRCFRGSPSGLCVSRSQVVRSGRRGILETASEDLPSPRPFPGSPLDRRRHRPLHHLHQRDRQRRGLPPRPAAEQARERAREGRTRRRGAAVGTAAARGGAATVPRLHDHQTVGIAPPPGGERSDADQGRRCPPTALQSLHRRRHGGGASAVGRDHGVVRRSP